MPLVDGLGFEELGQLGSQVASLWATGSINSDSQISGANLYATTAMRSVTVVGTTLVSGATLVGTNISGVTSVRSVTIQGTTVSGGNAIFAVIAIASSRVLSAAATGSPSTWGRLAQAGSAVTSAGSNVWVVYGTAFSAVPQVVATVHGTADVTLSRVTGSDAAGSAFFISQGGASAEFSWMAIGPA